METTPPSAGMKRQFQLQFNNCLESTPKYPRLLKSNTLSAKIPFQDITNTSQDVSITFDKYFDAAEKNFMSASEPLTPSSNIKLLTSVAANSKYLSSDPQNLPGLVSSSENEKENDEAKLKISRKSKSLGLLCRRFFALYPDYPGENKIIICLDQTAESLGVEKRRIYDIVNVLESVGFLIKVGKNTYRWFGKTNLASTVVKLKNEAKKENLEEKINCVVSNERMQCFRKMKSEDTIEDAEVDSTSPENVTFFEDDSLIISEDFCDISGFENKKEKSLSGMSRKFLMLCLACAPKSISLELAAQVIADCSVDRAEMVQFKTKIRRLYDIANVLMSVNLVQKLYVPGIRGRKPTFQYIGPDPNDCLDFSDSKPRFVKAKSADFDTHHSPKSESHKGNLRRNVSFQDICEAAEIERKKLYASVTVQELNKCNTDNLQQFTKDANQLSVVEAGTKTCCENSSLKIESAVSSQIQSEAHAQALHKVIKLTSEQTASILNVINISLDANQVASVQICGSSVNQSSVSLPHAKGNNRESPLVAYRVSEKVSQEIIGDSLLSPPTGQVVIYYPTESSNLGISLLKSTSQVPVNKIPIPSRTPLSIPVPLKGEKLCVSSLKNNLGFRNRSNNGNMDSVFVKDSSLQSENTEQSGSPLQILFPNNKPSSELIVTEPSNTNIKSNDVHSSYICEGESSNSEVESILENDGRLYLIDEKTICSPVVKTPHNSHRVSLTSPVESSASVCTPMKKTVPVFSHKLKTKSDLKVGDFIHISPKNLSSPGYVTPSRNFVISHLLQLPAKSMNPPSSVGGSESNSPKDLTVVNLPHKAE